MTTTPNRRRTSSRLDTIPVRPYGSDSFGNVPLADIEIVRPSSDGLVDVIYTVERDLPSDLTVRDIKSGETDITQVFIALGWQPGMSHNEDLAET